MRPVTCDMFKSDSYYYGSGPFSEMIYPCASIAHMCALASSVRSLFVAEILGGDKVMESDCGCSSGQFTMRLAQGLRQTARRDRAGASACRSRPTSGL